MFNEEEKKLIHDLLSTVKVPVDDRGLAEGKILNSILKKCTVDVK